jgi:murein DD-endopeptidase MepM/ murein hydrolase activator NlpD
MAMGLAIRTHRVRSWVESPYPLAATLAYDAELASLPAWANGVDGGLGDAGLPVEFAFQPGETLSDVLDELGFEPRDAESVIEAVAKHVDLRKLRPEDRYAAIVDPESRLKGFQLLLVGKGQVSVIPQDGRWQISWRPFVESVRISVVRGELEGSLEASIQRSGAHPTLAYVMADVLQWDLDFNRDLRLGDRFEILFETVYLDDEFYRVGEILALSYDNDGRRLEAYRFGEDGGYYDGEGRPLRKLFLRSPLRFSRITSRFSQQRFHPILKRYRPHHGVDYGAPTGTPVRVTANGVVRFAGWNGGGGRTVKVRHPNGYMTAYLHLSRFAKGIRSGRRVSQGEIIGYVGSTGLATASHLDYRIQRDGRWINPLGLKNEPAEPIAAAQRTEFFAWRDRLREALDAGQVPVLADPGAADLLAAERGVERPRGQEVAR